MNLERFPSTITQMNSYYLTLVLKPDLDEKGRNALLDPILKKILGEDGTIGKTDLWGNKELAYPIKKQTKGYIIHYELTTEPKNVKTLDLQLKVEESILRYLLVRK